MTSKKKYMPRVGDHVLIDGPFGYSLEKGTVEPITIPTSGSGVIIEIKEIKKMSKEFQETFPAQEKEDPPFFMVKVQRLCERFGQGQKACEVINEGGLLKNHNKKCLDCQKIREEGYPLWFFFYGDTYV